MKLTNRIFFFSVVIAVVWAVQSSAEGMSELLHVQQRWAEVNYQLKGKMQLTAFVQLVEEVEKLSVDEPRTAEIWLWRGIIKSSYAQARGGLGALGIAKEAKADLEVAINLDARALGGSSYTILGGLYHIVPRWPISFGNDRKAEELLRRAVALNPEGLDENYFYGVYLLDEKRYDEAEERFLQAQKAPVRVNRLVADYGRQREIREALESLSRKR